MDLMSVVRACCKKESNAWVNFFPPFLEIGRRSLRTFRLSQEEQEDILSQVLVKLYGGGLERFHGSSTGELVSYLKTIVRNESLTFIKQKSRNITVPEGVGEIPDRGQKPPETQFADKECLQILEEMISNLTVPEKELYLMKYRGLTEREISEQTGSPPGTVASRIKRLLDKLRANMREKGC
jgi:RNA polymerase sigma factor (sigma-70 family)